MKHLRLFSTTSEYENAELVKPNVSLIKETGNLNYISNKIPQIVYQFDCRNTPWEYKWLMRIKTLNGDFSELYDKIIEYLKTYGNKITDTYYTLGEYGTETPLENMNVSALADDYNTGEEKVYHLCWIDTSIDGDYINWGFNNVERGGNNMGGECDLYRDRFVLYEAIPGNNI